MYIIFRTANQLLARMIVQCLHDGILRSLTGLIIIFFLTGSSVSIRFIIIWPISFMYVYNHFNTGENLLFFSVTRRYRSDVCKLLTDWLSALALTLLMWLWREMKKMKKVKKMKKMKNMKKMKKMKKLFRGELCKRGEGGTPQIRKFVFKGGAGGTPLRGQNPQSSIWPLPRRASLSVRYEIEKGLRAVYLFPKLNILHHTYFYYLIHALHITHTKNKQMSQPNKQAWAY